MKEALRHLVKAVAPVTPPGAPTSGTGGIVLAEIVVRVNGAVESVRILDGYAALHQAAIDAVKQWTFRPFLQNGKPARVLALVEVRFPDPKREQEQRDLLARLRASPPTPPPPPRPPLVLRRLASVSCLCPDARELADEQLAGIIKVIPAGVRPWFIEASRPGPGAMVYLAATSRGPDYQSGGMAIVLRGNPATASTEALVFGRAEMSWILMRGPGPEPAVPLTRSDETWPIVVGWSIDQGPFTTVETAALVRAAQAEVTKGSRIDRLHHAGSLDAIVHVQDPSSMVPLLMSFRRDGTRWVLVRQAD
jgi:TonB family protein